MAEYIEKQAAVSYAISGMVRALPTNDGNENWIRTSEVRKNILSIPVADVVPVVHAYWRDTGSGQECSACKEIQYGYDTGRCFCANCGAKMDRERKEWRL